MSKLVEFGRLRPAARSPASTLPLLCSHLHSLLLIAALHAPAQCYWDMGTTTEIILKDKIPRSSFFEWQKNIERTPAQILFGLETDKASDMLCCIAGVSIDMIALSTAVLLSRRVLITAANYLEPYLTRQKDVRIWALGVDGFFNTPYRYRVWRFRRLIPRSNNPEHFHGPRGRHVARHDISIIHTLDLMYMRVTPSLTKMVACKANLAYKSSIFDFEKGYYFVGSGYKDMDHLYENYEIQYTKQHIDEIVNCEKYLPKWWGKFICILNIHGLAGVQNGAGLFTKNYLIGIGCFEIRYNDERVLVFTDVRYYIDWVVVMANITLYDYYEYAYPQWGVNLQSQKKALVIPDLQNSQFIQDYRTFYVVGG